MSSLTFPPTEVGIIANVSSEEHRRFFEKTTGKVCKGLFKPLNFEFGGLRGQIMSIDVSSPEIETSKSGYALAQECCVRAVEQLAIDPQLKVVVFTASTKRPGVSSEIHKKFPEVTFSIGDNGTILSALKLTDYFLNQMEKGGKICVMGAGFIGEYFLNYLLEKGFTNVSIFSRQNKKFPDGVRLCRSLEDVGSEVQLFISCTHNNCIVPSEFLKILDERAVIIDVAVPPGIGADIILPSTVRRFDAGDFFLPDLKCHFDPKLAHFPREGFWYGCFTEGVLLGLARKAGEKFADQNFFEINRENMGTIDRLLKAKSNSFCVPFINFFDPSTFHGVGMPY